MFIIKVSSLPNSYPRQLSSSLATYPTPQLNPISSNSALLLLTLIYISSHLVPTQICRSPSSNPSRVCQSLCLQNLPAYLIMFTGIFFPDCSVIHSPCDICSEQKMFLQTSLWPLLLIFLVGILIFHSIMNH